MADSEALARLLYLDEDTDYAHQVMTWPRIVKEQPQVAAWWRRRARHVAGLVSKAAQDEGAGEVERLRADLLALAEKWEREAEPYLYGGRCYDKAGDWIVARADCRARDAADLRAVVGRAKDGA